MKYLLPNHELTTLISIFSIRLNYLNVRISQSHTPILPYSHTPILS
jgi:hypothetical protein